MTSSGNGSTPDNGTATTYTQEQLEEMTIAQIRELAAERGYTITSSLKADIIAEFLEQQN